MTKYILFIFIPIILIANNKNYCYAKTKKEKYIGLKKFNTKEEFVRKCNGKMIFLYNKDSCKTFTMKNMKFDIYIEDKFSIQEFKIGERKIVCGKKIIETVK